MWLSSAGRAIGVAKVIAIARVVGIDRAMGIDKVTSVGRVGTGMAMDRVWQCLDKALLPE